jgi:hypothetical protein
MSPDPRAVEVTLATTGVEPTHGPGRLTEYSPGGRMLRAAGALLVFVGLAAALIPIPVIHLVGIPMMLVLGVVTAIRTLGREARLDRMHLPCPKCGARNDLGGGLGLADPTGPFDLSCSSCRRGLTMTIGKES